ncbi:hypothetical protein [Neptuniibacter sp. QD34_54]|uniref:hypothetical protein n=1 Tax=Neptuniibacter sp. QD34_54 TaxID=3398208 RepID=UPI0039F4C356
MISVRKTFLFIWGVLFVFSNVFISFFSQNIEGKLVLNILQGVDFALISIFLIFVILKWFVVLKEDFLIKLLLANFVVVVIYYLYGLINNGFVHSSIYLRMLGYPFIMGVMGYWVGSVLSGLSVLRFLSFVGLFVAVFVIVEFTFPEILYYAINAPDFYKLKLDDGYMTLDYLIESRQRRIFNMPGMEHVMVFKPAGPTFNYPSTSYILVFGLISAFLIKSYLVFFLCLLALMMLGTKAALACVLFVFISSCLFKFNFRFNVLILFVSGLFYALTSVLIMSLSNNIHIYSLMSSINHIGSNPLGKGLGWGGAATVERVVTWDYDMLVGDSGVAIALNMLGLFSVILFISYIVFLFNMADFFKKINNYEAFCFTGVGVAILSNSVLQELAIGPYGIGMVFFVIMIFYSNYKIRILGRGLDA